jgi:hypothetical protein
MTSLQAVVAAEHIADMQRAAASRRDFHAAPTRSKSKPEATRVLALRMADADDAALIRRLAELDGAPALEGPVLLAVVDGEPVAAISMTNSRIVADPFVPTQEAVALLRLRAKHLLGAGTRRRWRWRFGLRPRIA